MCVCSLVIPKILLFGIPITLQTLIIMLIGDVLKPKEAFLSVVLYLIIGLIGIPVFSGFNSGLAAFLGPTGGFLIAFPFATLGISLLKGKSIIHLIIVNILFGVIFTYSIGVISIAYHNQISYFNAYKTMLIFIPFDLLKAVIASLIAKRIKLDF
jgi:biotin transport system substrate-specific component